MVTTSLVNDGLGAQPDREILVADDAQTTARQIARLLTNAPLREQMGKAGRQFVRRRFSWTHGMERMRTIEENLQQDRELASL